MSYADYNVAECMVLLNLLDDDGAITTRTLQHTFESLEKRGAVTINPINRTGFFTLRKNPLWRVQLTTHGRETIERLELFAETMIA